MDCWMTQPPNGCGDAAGAEGEGEMSSLIEDEMLSEMVEKRRIVDTDAADGDDDGCHCRVEHAGDRRWGRQSCAACIHCCYRPEMVKTSCGRDGPGFPASSLMG
ncbi:hypothetical protein ACLOJK_035011 [Asimina triloba]